MATAKELREKRAKLITQAQAKVKEHQDPDTGLVPSEYQGEIDAMLEQAGQYGDQAKSLERLEGMSDSLDKAAGGNAGKVDHQLSGDQFGGKQPTIMVRQGNRNGRPHYVEVPVGKRGDADYRAAFIDHLRGNKLSPERKAALQSDDDAQAGYLVASEQFASEMLKDIDDEVFIRQHATVHTVLEAGSLGIKKRTTRMSTWGWSAELQVQTADSSLAYGKRNLEPHPATGLAKVSRDLIRRTAGGAEAEVRSEMARDAGEMQEDGFLTGTGNQRPLGVYVASSDGISTSRDFLTGSSTNFTFAGLLAAKYGLKAAYRKSTGSRSGCRWNFHRDGISKIAQLVDGNGQPIFRVGGGRQQDNQSPDDMLLGYPVDESERTPSTFTTGLYVGMLANWSYYHIADALDIEIQVLDQLYAESNQYGYIGRLKTDGMPVLEEAFVRLKTD